MLRECMENSDGRIPARSQQRRIYKNKCGIFERAIVAGQPAGDLAPFRPDDGDGIAAAERASDLPHAGRKQALAGNQRRLRAGIDGNAARRQQLPGNPGLACRHRRSGRCKPRRARAFSNRLQGSIGLTRGDDHGAARHGRDLAGIDPVRSAARKLGSRTAGHRLDFRGDGWNGFGENAQRDRCGGAV